jgi:hypothetical protein
MSEELELWQVAWRQGIAPLLTAGEAVLLHEALCGDSPELYQGGTVDVGWRQPGDLARNEPRSACALGYCRWKGQRLVTALDVIRAFNSLVDQADTRLRRDEATANVSDFLDWWDCTERSRAVRALLDEVERTLRERAGM